ncbi:MAG: hypothetical protein Kow00104_21460 [Rhodothalassiaceae bacterium]
MRYLPWPLLLMLALSAWSAKAEILVVGNKGEDSVGFIDLASGRMEVVRPTGRGPHEVAVSPDGRLAAVVAYGAGAGAGRSIDIFDVAKAVLRTHIDLGAHSRPHGILWHPDGRKLVVTTEGSGHLLVVDGEKGAIEKAIPTGGRGSHMVALSSDGLRAYVANLGSGTVSVIDIAAGERQASLEVGQEAEGIALSPDGSRLWVTARAEDRVMVFDTERLERIAAIATGRMPIRVAISPDGTRAVTSNARDGTLSLIDTASLKRIATVTPGEGATDDSMPVTLLFHPDGRSLFVALTNAARIVRFSVPDFAQSATIAAGKGSDGLGYSPLSPAWQRETP